MEETYTTEAIILSRRSFRESDSLITAYTQDYGKLDLVARGTKKLLSKLSPHLEPVTLSSLMIVKGKQFDYIGGAVNREAFFSIKEDLGRLEFSGQAINIFNHLVKQDEADKSLFFLLAEYLSILNTGRKIDLELLHNLFIFKLLCNLGYTPELNCCVNCENKDFSNNISFNYAKGGLECKKCVQDKNTLTINKNCVKVLQFAVNNNLNELINLKIAGNIKLQIIKAISSFYQYNFN